jgi:hypothetical protein
MEEDYVGPYRREAEFKRRQRWLKRAWRVSRAGNCYVNVMGSNAMIFPRGEGWGARVVDRESGRRWFSRACATPEEAKLLAFDLLAEMNEQEGYD